MSALKNPLPVRRRSYRFALTPLADTMFQLLIFFMVSSSLTPYSLITLQSAPNGTAQSAAPQTPYRIDETATIPAPQATQTGPQGPVWRLLEGRVEAGGQEFSLTQLNELALALGDQAVNETVTLLLGSDARMQDVASAMAALQSANITGIRIAREGAK